MLKTNQTKTEKLQKRNNIKAEDQQSVKEKNWRVWKIKWELEVRSTFIVEPVGNLKTK